MRNHQGESVGVLPDFVVIGTMKSGSTTLYRWLDEHPAIEMPRVKEPNFFSDDHRYRAGLASYQRNFAACSSEKLTGEASVRYTDPQWASTAAQRLHATLPSSRLICLLRDPVDRMRSHFRHEVLRGRERRPFNAATAAPDNPYVRCSSYARALEPWVRTFPAEQLLVVTFEDLVRSERVWCEVLDFLGLERVPVPTTAYNTTSEKRAFSPVMRVLWDTGLAQRMPTPSGPLRRMARLLLLHGSKGQDDLMESASAPVDPAVLGQLHRELERLQGMLPGFHADWSR